MAGKTLKEGFYRVEIQEWNSVFEMPVRYRNVIPIKAGGFGQVV